MSATGSVRHEWQGFAVELEGGLKIGRVLDVKEEQGRDVLCVSTGLLIWRLVFDVPSDWIVRVDVDRRRLTLGGLPADVDLLTSLRSPVLRRLLGVRRRSS